MAAAALLAAFVSVAAQSQVVASPEEVEAAYVHKFLS